MLSAEIAAALEANVPQASLNGTRPDEAIERTKQAIDAIAK